jgi:hypothetical protein
VARVYRRNDVQFVWCFSAVDEPVFAARPTSAGRWSILAPGCRDRSGQTGVRRIAVLDEPAASGEIVSGVTGRSERRLEKITDSYWQMIAVCDEPAGKNATPGRGIKT